MSYRRVSSNPSLLPRAAPTEGSCSHASSSTSSSSNRHSGKKTDKDFIFAKIIGEGSFSHVYLAVDPSNERQYAIKVCDKRTIERERKKEYIYRERVIMQMMSNIPGFLDLYCSFHDQRYFFFVTTLAKNGTLLQLLQKESKFHLETARHYAAELLLACEQMHRLNIIHRDLKPENILLDSDMHTLIADFGSAKILPSLSEEVKERKHAEDLKTSTSSMISSKSTENTRVDCLKLPSNDSMAKSNSFNGSPSEILESSNIGKSEENLSTENENKTEAVGACAGAGDAEPVGRLENTAGRYQRNRRQVNGSFVGTAQYVSPEVIHSEVVTPMADLWAFGCIIYQMISGSTPFRGDRMFSLFKEIKASNISFPEDFDTQAKDLVQNLLQAKPSDRLGANDESGDYKTIRNHPFFAGIDFNKIRKNKVPYVPSNYVNESSIKLPKDWRTFDKGLDEKQLLRLFCGAYLPKQTNEEKSEVRRYFDLSPDEKNRLFEMQKQDIWHQFADNEYILKKGFVNKRKGLFPRKRMFLLTTGPRIIYIDPVPMIKKGEIPWSSDIKVEAKNFKNFWVHTPNRIYYLEEPNGFALPWVAAIKELHKITYLEQDDKENNKANDI